MKGGGRALLGRVAVLVVLASGPCPLPAAESSGKGLKDVGFGVILGTPFGASAKYWLGETLAVDFAVGVQGQDLDLHGDFLVHPKPVPLPGSKETKIPFYIGLGLKVRDTPENTFGIRFVGGVHRRFVERRIEVFLELAPILRVTPSLDSFLDGGAGLRYYFG